MRWPWTRGRHARKRHGVSGPPAPVPREHEELTARRQEADQRLSETISRWPEVAGQSLRLARLNRENHLSGLIDKALRSGPT